jgi:hypothetical protein
MYHQLNWFTVGISLASLFAVIVVTNLLRAERVEWHKMLEQPQQTTQQVLDRARRFFQAGGNRVIEQLASTTQETASEVTEEAIIAAVDRAINVIQTASQEVRERKIPTENVALEVSVKIMGVVELKMKADVPKEEQLKENIKSNSEDEC